MQFFATLNTFYALQAKRINLLQDTAFRKLANGKG
ncbi:predicted protein [Sclerotinia sclerotiorum 1980 UF-70]|uniref:Uncharacterized protein n=1 Tax=Sclerotinia sclerotiorum (strain ATCC 18683 / 1980 / Ss-1) TaxID=665079 RepID=A7E6P0_SCLS1|nr:predicted protein [Sclerotinia sclerotiorum 1980 UF-70]EDN91562.1 predicted protein [Sclerotinia sclerotiorum 1980 UF-70]